MSAQPLKPTQRLQAPASHFGYHGFALVWRHVLHPVSYSATTQPVNPDSSSGPGRELQGFRCSCRAFETIDRPLCTAAQLSGPPFLAHVAIPTVVDGVFQVIAYWVGPKLWFPVGSRWRRMALNDAECSHLAMSSSLNFGVLLSIASMALRAKVLLGTLLAMPELNPISAQRLWQEPPWRSRRCLPSIGHVRIPVRG